MGLISRVSSRTYRTDTMGHGILKSAAWALAYMSLAQAELFNMKVQRKINLQKHFLSIDSSVTIKNSGKGAVSRVKLLPDPLLADHLSQFLVYNKGKAVWVDTATWEAQLLNAIQPDDTVELSIEEIYTHVTKPLPTKIKQTMDQLMTYEGSLHHYSPYVTRRESVSASFPSKKVIKFTPEENAKKSGSTIKFGEYKDLPANADDKVYFHYEANIPFVSTHYLFREVEVSHWGNVKITDNADVRHRGAELDGTFSRVQYNHDGGDGASNVHWVPSLTATLPVAAYDVYYGDEIGNISTSGLRQHRDRVEVQMRPRTPLFGGWKSDYTLRYNLPSEKALFYSKSDSSRFTLTVQAIDNLYADQVVDQVELQIVLPEAATNIDVKVPAGYQRGHDELKFTYLDISGRPVVVLRAENLSGKALEEMLEVSYTFSASSIYREPIMTITFFMIIFLCVMFLVRLDFTIADDGSGDAKARINAAFQKAQEANNSRCAAHDVYRQSIDRYRQTKELSLIKAPQQSYKKQADIFCRSLTEISAEHKGPASEKLAVISKIAGNLGENIAKGEPGFAKLREQHDKINENINQALA